MKNFAILATIAGVLYAAFEAGEYYNYNKHVQLRADLLRWITILVKDAKTSTLVELMQDKKFNELLLEYLENKS